MTGHELDVFVERVTKLSPSEQTQLLKRLIDVIGSSGLAGTSTTYDIDGESLWRRAREVDFSAQAIQEMMQEIEEGCERIDWDGWQ
jgi:hypothetical protein